MSADEPKLPRAPMSVIAATLGTMFAQLGLTALMFFSPPVVAGVLLAVGLVASVALSLWTGAALRREGGSFLLDAVRTHTMGALGVFSAIGTPMLFFGLAGSVARASGSLSEAFLGLSYAGIGLVMLLAYLSFTVGWTFVKKPAAEAAYANWLARRDDPRMVRWRSIRRRAEGSPRAAALVDRSIEALERLLFDTPDPVELAALDAAADRLEDALGRGTELSAQLDDAEDEIRAMREVERLGRVAARTRETR
ncbi:MAG: hypothetical protein H6738_09625 [Alphaproteobacteria bacterium]|nr:hypothetical protein [Alphaproteobacteria bacterium]